MRRRPCHRRGEAAKGRLPSIVLALAAALTGGTALACGPTSTPSVTLTPSTTSAPIATGSATPSLSPTSVDGLLDARDYGAKGDGTSDDTAALSAALTAAAKADSGVYIPAGVYKVSTLSIPDGITVRAQDTPPRGSRAASSSAATISSGG